MPMALILTMLSVIDPEFSEPPNVRPDADINFARIKQKKDL